MQKRFARQNIVGFLVITLQLGFVSACSNWSGDGNAVSDKVERATVSVWAPMQSQSANEVMRQQVAAFNADQRNVQIELSLLNRSDYVKRIYQARSDHILPGIVCLDLAQFEEFAAEGVLQPLEKMMSQRLWNDVLPDLLEQGHIGTHIYGVPAIHKPDQELLWTVVDDAKDKSATMAFIHYLLHPERQRQVIAAGGTQPVTYSAMP